MNAIRVQQSDRSATTLIVPDEPVIPFIEGDGIGRDICLPSLGLFDAAVEKAYGGRRKIRWKEVLAGEKAQLRTGQYLPPETLTAFKEYVVGIKGPLGTPVGEGIRSINVALRQTLDLYACFRPVRWIPGMPAPIRHPEHVAMHIFRENTEDLYAGIEFMTGDAAAEKLKRFLIEDMGVTAMRFPETTSIGIKPISREGSERLIRAAILYAVRNRLPSVTLVHKGNIMKFTEGAFRNWGYALAEREFDDQVFTMNQYQLLMKEKGKSAAADALIGAKQAGKVIIKDCITDAFLQETLLHPADYSVIAAPNLNGDYISDQIAAMVGGIGTAPGANINYHSGHAVFEPVHGTAPGLAGTGKANPCSFILSGALMLEYLGWHEAADGIRRSIDRSITPSIETVPFIETLIGNLDQK